MNPQTYIGCAVTVILREGSYHGTIHRFDSVDKRITLKDVSNPVNGNKYPGIRHFYASEIFDMVLDDDYDESLIDNPPCAVIQTDDAPAYQDAYQGTSKASNAKKILVPESPPATSCDRYTIIDEFNGQFQEAMTLIQEQMMIGFHIISVGEGREGSICWIAISMKTHAYLFDYLALGKNFFKNGLQDVLESKKITKIIHDCRFISNLLFHKYSVNLSNVFDTQVADAFVHRTWYGVGNKNVWPKFVQPLSVCLFSHLKLTTEEIAGLNAWEGRHKVEQDLWSQRPLSIPLAETLACSVKYLHELRLLLIEKMMVEYMAGVDIYLNTVRNLPSSEVFWYANKSEFLPKTFQQMNKFTQVIKDSFKNREREFSILENNLDRIQQMTSVSSKMHNNSESIQSYKLDSPFVNPGNTESNKSPSQIKENPVAEYAPSNDKIITSVHRLPTLTAENKSSLKTSPANAKEDDILIQAARKMIASDIPSDLLDLLKTPVKPPPMEFDSSPKMSHSLDSPTDKNSYFNHTGVEWSMYRKDGLDCSKISLLPAGCNMSQTKKKTKSKQSNNSIHIDKRQSFPKKSPPQLCQSLNNENKNSFQRHHSDGTRQNGNLNDQITDPFLDFPDSGFTQDYNVLGQIQTYPVSRQSFEYRTNKNNPHTNRNGDTNNNSSSIDSHSYIHTETKCPVSNSIKATPPRTSSEEWQSPLAEKSSLHNSSQMKTDSRNVKENGTSRNWVNGNGIAGSGSMTHIERLMAIWRNDCK